MIKMNWRIEKKENSLAHRFLETIHQLQFFLKHTKARLKTLNLFVYNLMIN